MDRYTFSMPSTIAVVVNRLFISAASGEQNPWHSDPPWKNIFSRCLFFDLTFIPVIKGPRKVECHKALRRNLRGSQKHFFAPSQRFFRGIFF
jgi:hypothetical protein